MRLLLLITGNGVSLPVTELVLLPNLILWLVCQFRQLGDIRRDPSRLVAREQLGRRPRPGPPMRVVAGLPGLYQVIDGQSCQCGEFRSLF